MTQSESGVCILDRSTGDAKKKHLSIFYAPNFEEVEGAYWFGPVRLSVCPSDRLSVCPSVRPSVCPLRLMLVVKLENGLS